MLYHEIVKTLVEICRQHVAAFVRRYLASDTTQQTPNFSAFVGLVNEVMM
jgi:hypothetical protein